MTDLSVNISKTINAPFMMDRCGKRLGNPGWIRVRRKRFGTGNAIVVGEDAEGSPMTGGNTGFFANCHGLRDKGRFSNKSQNITRFYGGN